MAKYGKPKSAFTGKAPGQSQRQGKKASVDLATGKPTKSYWQRAKAFATRKQKPTRAPQTMGERLGSISRTATTAIGGQGKVSRPGGQLNIPKEAAKTKGPSLASQAGTREAGIRRQELSLAMKMRKGQRVTAADVPGHGKGPVAPGRKDPRAPGAATVTRTREPSKGDLGAYTVKGYKPPAPKRRKKKPGRKIPKRAPTFMEMLRGQTK